MHNIQSLIDHLQLQPHPEGGYFRETYRSTGIIDGKELSLDSDRNFSTAIYFMLTSDNFSAFHRIKSDEVWHFYAGAPLYVHVIDQLGVYHRHQAGINIEKGEVPQLVVKAGDWFGSSVATKDSFSLVGCTVAPGFDFRDFEMAERDKLLREFPEHKEIIIELTRV
jgi:uncharacterized protein